MGYAIDLRLRAHIKSGESSNLAFALVNHKSPIPLDEIRTVH